jgi:hypothetical protein
VVVISWPSDLRRMPSARASFLSSSTSKTFIMTSLFLFLWRGFTALVAFRNSCGAF